MVSEKGRVCDWWAWNDGMSLRRDGTELPGYEHLPGPTSCIVLVGPG